MKFESTLGHVNKIQFIKYLYGRVNYEFQKDEYMATTAFAKAYGIKGVYLSDLDEEIMASPLVLIQQSDLAELVASKQLAERWADSEGYNEEEIKLKAKQISKNYLLENGMSEEDYEFFKDLYGEQ